MGLKRQIAERISPLWAEPVLRPLHDRLRQPLLILAYHRVLPLPDPSTYPFDLELISATPEQFDFQMRYLRSNFDPVTMSDLVAHVREGQPLPPRPALVTFDDGYEDNLVYAGPVARQHGIVPTIFLATDYVGATTPYWFEWVVYLMMRVPVGSLSVDEGPRLPVAADPRSRRKGGGILQEALKRMPIDRILRLLGQWTEEFKAYVNPDEFRLSGLLTWEQVAAMDQRGFEFGSHSVSHAVLANLTDADLRDEVTRSKQILETRLGHEVPTIAYPVGKEFAFSGRVEEITREAGYVLGTAYVPGVNYLGELNRYALRRQNIERFHSETYFKWMMRFPRWAQ